MEQRKKWGEQRKNALKCHHAFTKHGSVRTSQEAEGAFIFCCIPSYFSVIKTNSFACPWNQNKQSRCSSDLFLFLGLVRVSPRSVTYRTRKTKDGFSEESRFAPLCFVTAWWWCYACANKQTHVPSRASKFAASKLPLLYSGWLTQTSTWCSLMSIQFRFGENIILSLLSSSY